MSESKYAKYVNEFKSSGEIVLPWNKKKVTQPMEFDSRWFDEMTHHFEFFIIYAAGGGWGRGKGGIGLLNGKEVKDEPHIHPYDEFFLFLGTNPEDPTDLGGELEYWLGKGEEAEKFLITKSSCVYVPKGMVHQPIQVNRVDRPFIKVVMLDAPIMRGGPAKAFPSKFKIKE